MPNMMPMKVLILQKVSWLELKLLKITVKLSLVKGIMVELMNKLRLLLLTSRREIWMILSLLCKEFLKCLMWWMIKNVEMLVLTGMLLEIMWKLGRAHLPLPTILIEKSQSMVRISTSTSRRPFKCLTRRSIKVSELRWVQQPKWFMLEN